MVKVYEERGINVPRDILEKGSKVIERWIAWKTGKELFRIEVEDEYIDINCSFTQFDYLPK